MDNQCIVFDLDDTLYKEIDFLKSGYHYISDHLPANGISRNALYRQMLKEFYAGRDAFAYILKLYPQFQKVQLLEWYRYHYPDISLNDNTLATIRYLAQSKYVIGILTDGRSITQRNKIRALGLNKYVEHQNIIISEEFGSSKPHKENYNYFMNLYPDYSFIYVGDNTSKDFETPKALGWKTIGLRDSGENIHKQNLDRPMLQPDIWINCISEIIAYET